MAGGLLESGAVLSVAKGPKTSPRDAEPHV